MATIKKITNWVKVALKAKEVPFIIGSPGQGKSDLLKQIAEYFNLEFVDIRLSQMDPVEINGMPKIMEDKFEYIPAGVFPLEGDPLPKGKDGWLCVFEELNSASRAVEVAAYKIILDRLIGVHKLHPKVVMAATGNKNTDGAVAHALGTAMQSRLITFELETSKDEWTEWANKNEIDHRIISFIEFRPDALMAFDPHHNDYTFPCPRTWAKMSGLLKKAGDIDITDLDLLAGCIGKGMSRDFFSHMQVADSLVSIEEILRNPEGVKIPTEPFDARIALAAMVSAYATPGNLGILTKFITRLPIENQVVAIRSMIQRDRTIYQEEPIQDWVRDNTSEILV